MSGANLPTNIDSSYPPSPTDPSADLHQQHHDVLHRWANRFDVDAMPGAGQVLAFDAATNLFKPVNPAAAASTDLTGTPYIVSADTGGTGAYPARPATTRPVIFRGTTQPTTDGSTSGGGGMVLGLDEWRYWSGADAGAAPSAAGVTTDAASTSTSLAPAAKTTRQMIGQQGPTVMLTSYVDSGIGAYKGALQSILDSDSSSVATAKLASNDAILQAAIAAANGRRVVCEQDFPFSTVITGAANLDIGAIVQRGDTQFPNQNGTGVAGTRGVKPALTFRNLYGTAQTMVSAGQVQFGPPNPAQGWLFAIMGLLVLPGVGTTTLPASNATGQDAQGGYRRYKVGQVGQLGNKDWFTWSVETGLHNGSDPNIGVFRAENCKVAGIWQNVSSVNLTGAGTQMSGANTGVLTLERHVIKGATSGREALANGWTVNGTDGVLLFGSVTGDFYQGENLIDKASGNVIGVAGTMGVALSFRPEFDYKRHERMAAQGGFTQAQIDAYKPQFRLIDQAASVRGRVRVRASHDPDLFAPTADRSSAAIQIDGAFMPVLDVEVTGPLSRAVLVRSCHMPKIRLLKYSGGANHALGVSVPNSEEAYPYGIEIRGTTYGGDFEAHGSDARHLLTSNPATKNWEASTDSHLDYGTIQHNTVHDSKAVDCYGAGFDLHEGAWYTRFVDCEVTRSQPGGRAVTVSLGFNNRGFGTVYESCHVTNGAGGFAEGGAGLTAGAPHRIVYRNCTASRFWSDGFATGDSVAGTNQDGTTTSTWFATIEFDSCTSSADPSITTAVKTSNGFNLGASRHEFVGTNKVRGINSNAVLLDAGGSTEFFGGPLFDFAIGQNTPNGIRSNGTQLTPIMLHEPIKVRARTSTVPNGLLRNAGGNSVWIHRGRTGLVVGDTTGTAALPPMQHPTVVGTPTWIDQTPTGGGSSTPTTGHDTSIPPTITLNPTGSSTPPNGTSGTTVSLAAGSDDLSGEIILNVTNPTTSTGPGQLLRLDYGTPYTSKAFVSVEASSETTGVGAQTKTPYVMLQRKTGFVIALAAALNAGESRFAYVVSGDSVAISALDTSNLPVFTPEQFGAKGDGTTDDAAAFTAAQNAMVAAGRGLLRLSGKTYRTSYLPSFVPKTAGGPLTYAVQGQGSELTQILFVGSSVASGLTVSNPSFNPDSPSTGAPEWFGFSIDGSGSSNGACGLSWGDISYGTLTDIELTGFASGDGLSFTNQYGWCEGMNLRQVRSTLNGVQVRWDVGSGRTLGTITTALTSGTAYTSIAVSGGVSEALYQGQPLVIAASTSARGVYTQTVRTTAAVAQGAASIPVTSFTAGTAYTANTAKVHFGGYGSYDYWSIEGLYLKANAGQHGWVSEKSRGIDERIDRLGSRIRVTGNFANAATNTGWVFWCKGRDTYSDTDWDFTIETGGAQGNVNHGSVRFDNTEANLGGHGVFSCYGSTAYSGQLYQVSFDGIMCVAGISSSSTTGFAKMKQPGRTNIFGGVRPSSGYPASVTSGTSWQNTTGRDLWVIVPVTFTSAGTAGQNTDTYSGLPAGATEIAGPSGTTQSLRFLHHADAWARIDATNATLGTPKTTYAG